MSPFEDRFQFCEQDLDTLQEWFRGAMPLSAWVGDATAREVKGGYDMVGKDNSSMSVGLRGQVGCSHAVVGRDVQNHRGPGKADAVLQRRVRWRRHCGEWS